MARNDAMRDPYYALILLEIEKVLHETDLRAKEQGLPFTDSAVRSLLVRAANEARGKPVKTAPTSPKDRLLADAVVRLGEARAKLGVAPMEDENGNELDPSAGDVADAMEPLPTADWLLALDAAKQSCEVRSTNEPGSRGYLDFLTGFLANAREQMKRPRA